MKLSHVKQLSCGAWSGAISWTSGARGGLPDPKTTSLYIATAGRVSGGGEQLAAFDLDDDEWAAFSEGIGRLASEQARPNCPDA